MKRTIFSYFSTLTIKTEVTDIPNFIITYCVENFCCLIPALVPQRTQRTKLHFSKISERAPDEEIRGDKHKKWQSEYNEDILSSVGINEK